MKDTTQHQPTQGPNLLDRRAALLTNAEAAEYLGIAPTTLEVWRCTRRYSIVYLKVGYSVRYRKEDLDAWLASRTVGAQVAA